MLKTDTFRAACTVIPADLHEPYHLYRSDEWGIFNGDLLIVRLENEIVATYRPGEWVAVMDNSYCSAEESALFRNA